MKINIVERMTEERARSVNFFDGRFAEGSWWYLASAELWMCTVTVGEYVRKRRAFDTALDCYRYAVETEVALHRAFYELPADVPIDWDYPLVGGYVHSLREDPSASILKDAEHVIKEVPTPPSSVIETPANSDNDTNDVIRIGYPAPITWLGRRIVSRIDYVADNSDKFVAAVQCGESVKLIHADSVRKLRDVSFWIDRCIDRYIRDSALIAVDDCDGVLANRRCKDFVDIEFSEVNVESRVKSLMLLCGLTP